ncbi:segregation/condensation protein A [Patescibacteria group bacterium]|nr:segregation/condensation protein A [Patescibacteria group bacterium]
MHSAEFSIRTEVFEGPLDLLLTLIEKRKLFINDISLSCVTDDFIAYTKKINDFPISQAAHFVLIASTLLLLKSRSLLPTLSLTDEEEGNIEDLEHRLKLYKYFKKLSREIENNFGKNIIFPRTFVKSFEPLFSPPSDLTVQLMDSSLKNILN